MKTFLSFLIPILLVSESIKYCYLYPNFITTDLLRVLGYPTNLNQTEGWKIMPITNSKSFDIKSKIPDSRKWVISHLTWSISLCFVVWCCILEDQPFGCDPTLVSIHFLWICHLSFGVTHFLNFDRDIAIKINFGAIFFLNLCLVMHHIRFRWTVAINPIDNQETEKKRKMFWTQLYILILLLPTFVTFAINIDILILKNLYRIFSI